MENGDKKGLGISWDLEMRSSIPPGNVWPVGGAEKKGKESNVRHGSESDFLDASDRRLWRL